MSKDFLRRFIFEQAPVRGEHVYLHESFLTIINQHPYPAPIRRLLGEALAVSALLSAIIKFEGRLTVQFRGNGHLKMLLAQCDNQCRLRGLVKWDGQITYEGLLRSFREGVLVIMLDQGANQKRYQGIVNWQGHSLAESIEGYFQHSEQLATKIWLAVNDTTAAGYLLQITPGSNQQLNAEELAQHQQQWSRIVETSISIQSEDLLQPQIETTLNKFYPEDEIRLFTPTPVEFHCTCSRERSETAIKLMGQAEAEEELKTHNSIVVTCEFCNQEYLFDRTDIERIFSEEPPPALH